jgi:radical SAM protein with 4Fe4S-binding SPASM domain
MIDNGKFETVYLSIFEDHFFSPKDPQDNANWCGGTGAMLSCDYKGDLYPCIRYMESSLGDSIAPMIIGNVDTGIMATEKQCDCVHCLRAITRRTQSTDECFYCPIAEGCAWCSAYNYQTFGTADHRATFICVMHKARALANLYYWNKGFRKYAPYFRMKNYVPYEWAIKILSQKQIDEISELEKFSEEDYEAVKAIGIENVPLEYRSYYQTCIDTKEPVYTNVHEMATGEVNDPEIDKIINSFGDES